MKQLFKKADDSFANRRNTCIVMGSKKGRGSIYHQAKFYPMLIYAYKLEIIKRFIYFHQ